YWQNQLKSYQGITLPTTPNDENESSAAEIEINTTLETSLAIKSICRDMDTSVYSFLLAVFKLSLREFSQSDDITVGSPFLNRSSEYDQNLVDMKMNTLAIRSKISESVTFRDFLKNIGLSVRAALKHQSAPLERVSHNLQRSLKNRLFDTMCIFHNYGPLKTIFTKEGAIKACHMHNMYATYDLVLEGCELEGQLNILLRYRLDAFDAGFIKVFADFFKQTLNLVLSNPDISLHSINTLDSVIAFGRGVQSDYGIKRGYGSTFKTIAETYSEKIAVASLSENITYKGLDDKSEWLANALNIAAVQKGDIVAIHMNRGINFAIAMIGILKAGAVFVPIDTSYPSERIRNMILDSGAKVIVTDGKYSNLTPGIKTIELNSLSKEVAEDAKKKQQSLSVLDSAYIVYTSGSTGTPKGTINHHLGLMNHI
ncbi:MAG: hypothetical protein EOP48_27070, partial [Sphingobacteriales bacterium]